MGLMVLYADDFRSVFWWALLPAVIAVLLIVVAVREPVVAKFDERKRTPISRADLVRMSCQYWTAIGIAVAFTMARFSEALLILKGEQAGLLLAQVPLVWVVINLVYTLLATPAGAWSDRIGRRAVLVTGL